MLEPANYAGWGLLCCVLSQQLRLETLHPLPKVIGSGSSLTARPNTGPKHFQKEPVELGPAAHQHPIVLGLTQILQNGVGSGCPARPIALGFGWAARPKDIIIYIINILNFIISNIIICIINIIFFIIIKCINIKNNINCVINIIIFIIILSINIKIL